MRQEPIAAGNASLDAFDARLTRALERPPEPRIPAAFAARVASRVPARKPFSITPTHYGRRVALFSLVALLAALLATAPHGSGSSVWGLALEWLLAAQFLALVVWLGLWRRDVG
jgi:hypothetical protein